MTVTEDFEGFIQAGGKAIEAAILLLLSVLIALFRLGVTGLTVVYDWVRANKNWAIPGQEREEKL